MATISHEPGKENDIPKLYSRLGAAHPPDADRVTTSMPAFTTRDGTVGDSTVRRAATRAHTPRNADSNPSRRAASYG